VSTDPRWSEIADFQPIFARSFSAVTPSKKVQLTLIGLGSPLRAFQWVQYNGWWSSYVAPKSPKGGLKNAKQSGNWPASVKLIYIMRVLVSECGRVQKRKSL